MRTMLEISDAAVKLGVTERHLRRLCDEGRLSGAAKINNRWQVPADADPRLCDQNREVTPSADTLLDMPEKKKNEALLKLAAIGEFETFCGKFIRAGSGGRSDAITVFASQKKIPARSLARWISKYRDQGFVGLVDSRGKGQFFSDIISPDAFELFKTMFLTQQRLSVKTCWQNINFVNKDQDKKWNIPPLPTMYDYVKKNIPRYVLVLMREGIAAYEAQCAPYIEVDPDSLEPGQVFIGDHHQCNCWVQHRGSWVRPWITCWEDMRSRAIVGWHVSTSPNQTTIMLAMKRAIENYGPPDSVKIDNGKDYDSELWTGTTKQRRQKIRAGLIDEQMAAGLYAMMGIGVSFSIPYHPQSKAIERFFDTLDRQFIKTIKTYCGKNNVVKPDSLIDYMKTKKAVDESYDIVTFGQQVDRYIAAYNSSAHSGRGMEGKSPDVIMAARTSRRVLAEGVLELLMRVWSGELTVGKNGVQFKSLWYGKFDLELMSHQGRKVRIAYDPDDMRAVYVYDASTLKLICIAEQSQLIGYGDKVNEEALRDAMKQKHNAVRFAKSFRNSRLAANMDLTDLTIKAMADAADSDAADCKDSEQPKQAATLRPVHTPLNMQVEEHARRIRTKRVKMAAGCEEVNSVIDFNFNLLNPKGTSAVKLFDE